MRKLLIVFVLILVGLLVWVQRRPDAVRPVVHEPPGSSEASVYWDVGPESLAGPEIVLADSIPLDAFSLPDTVPTAADTVGQAAGAEPPTSVVLAAVPVPVTQGDRGDPVLHVQVLLDRARFSPGQIDARWGQNTQSAVEWFQRTEALPETGLVDSLTLERLYERAGEPRSFVTSIQITAEDLAGPFNRIPPDVYQQDDLRCLCYQTPLEALSEKYHVHPEILGRLNPEANLDSLAAGDSLRVPDVAWTLPDSIDVARIVISDAGHWLHALDADGRILYHLPTTLGSRYDPSPTGEYHVTRIAEEPWFYYQPKLLAGVDDDLPPTRLPPGPNNPVGLVWIALSKEHFGIHGTPEPSTIGYATSSGCVRLTNWDAVFLSKRIRAEIPVQFQDVAGEVEEVAAAPN